MSFLCCSLSEICQSYPFDRAYFSLSESQKKHQGKWLEHRCSSLLITKSHGGNVHRIICIWEVLLLKIFAVITILLSLLLLFLFCV